MSRQKRVDAAGAARRGRQGAGDRAGRPAPGPADAPTPPPPRPSRPPPRCRPATSPRTSVGSSRLQRDHPGREGRRRHHRRGRGAVPGPRRRAGRVPEAHATAKNRLAAAEAEFTAGETALRTAEASLLKLRRDNAAAADRDRTPAGGRRAADRRRLRLQPEHQRHGRAPPGTGRGPVRARPARRPVHVVRGGAGPVRLLRPDVGGVPVPRRRLLRPAPGLPRPVRRHPGAAPSRRARCSPATCSSSPRAAAGRRSTTSACTSATARWCRRPPPATSSRSRSSAGPGSTPRPG